MRPSAHSVDPAVRATRPVPAHYATRLARYLRSSALDGRGDDARGRHLASLYALEWALEHELCDYRPSRDPGRWMLLVLDVGGARIGLGPEARTRLAVGDLLVRLADVGLVRVARRTESALAEGLAEAWRAPRDVAGARLARTTVAETMWWLGVPETGPQGREKHPQGRQLRKVLRARIDEAWEAELAVLEDEGEIDAATVLAAIPVSYEVAARVIQAGLARVDEDLHHVPFAVFYALLSDARRGGRVWRPSDCFLEASAYDRATFDAAVGHALPDSRSRKRRYRRSSALAELGLSAFFPATFARIDRWLGERRFPEFCLSGRAGAASGLDWYPWSHGERSRIAARHRELLASLKRRARAAPTR